MKFIYTLLLLISSFLGLSQNEKPHRNHSDEVIQGTGIIRCASTSYQHALQSRFPQMQTEEQFEKWMAEKIEEKQTNRVAAPQNIYTIPCVVHVIHDGNAVGNGENISDAKVRSQITVLNQDFRRMVGTNGFNSNAVGADVEIEFCLAQQTPAGAPSNGINRVNLGISQWTTKDEVQDILKVQTQWDPTRYFNIWVAYFTDDQDFRSSVTPGGLNGVLGYAQFPEASTLGGVTSNPSAITDGVVIDFRAFGSQAIASGSYYSAYNRGKTTSHEIGHSLGLRHVWGDNTSCVVNATDSNKDFCPDTPAANVANEGCLTIVNSCPSSPGNDMTENYMDYSNDACLNVFTINQKARMRTVMENSPRRLSLRTSIVCQPASNPNYNLLNDLLLFPNPAKDLINISVGTKIDKYEIYNNLGQIIASKKYNSENDLSINISQYSSGVYYIKVFKDDKSKTQQFIKN